MKFSWIPPCLADIQCWRLTHLIRMNEWMNEWNECMNEWIDGVRLAVFIEWIPHSCQAKWIQIHEYFFNLKANRVFRVSFQAIQHNCVANIIAKSHIRVVSFSCEFVKGFSFPFSFPFSVSIQGKWVFRDDQKELVNSELKLLYFFYEMAACIVTPVDLSILYTH